jgi:hypothetical protein
LRPCGPFDAIQSCITVPATASVRDLRNQFSKVRKILETEGEVLLTESGTARYRLTPYLAPLAKTPTPVDYWATLTSRQPKPISSKVAKALYKENRGDR